ncbi:hypothetical protein BKI52_05795 [marine bacterium AO1-C]|nr:hypothetical protein BKI52_05795 [marine bacterium AO1-C]
MKFITEMTLTKKSLFTGFYALALVLFLAACGGGAKENNTETDTTAKQDTTATADTNKEMTPEDKMKKAFEENTQAYAEVIGKLSKKWKEVSFEHKDGKVENVEKENDYLIFKNDGTFEEYFHTDKKIEAGLWSLEKEGKVVHLFSTEHRVMQDVRREIVELTADKMIWLDNTKKKSTFKLVGESSGDADGTKTDSTKVDSTK